MTPRRGRAHHWGAMLLFTGFELAVLVGALALIASAGWRPR